MKLRLSTPTILNESDIFLTHTVQMKHILSKIHNCYETLFLTHTVQMKQVYIIYRTHRLVLFYFLTHTVQMKQWYIETMNPLQDCFLTHTVQMKLDKFAVITVLQFYVITVLRQN